MPRSFKRRISNGHASGVDLIKEIHRKPKEQIEPERLWWEGHKSLRPLAEELPCLLERRGTKTIPRTFTRSLGQRWQLPAQQLQLGNTQQSAKESPQHAPAKMQCPDLKPLDKLRALYRAECPHRSVEWDILGFHRARLLFRHPNLYPNGQGRGPHCRRGTHGGPLLSASIRSRWTIDCWYIFNYVGRIRGRLHLRLRSVASQVAVSCVPQKGGYSFL